MHIKHVLPRLYKDHKQLLEAIRARDPERAEKAFRMHNQLIMRLLQEEILKKEAKVE
jgi:DNA-binding FadR family transcriptional regulator